MDGFATCVAQPQLVRQMRDEETDAAAVELDAGWPHTATSEPNGSGWNKDDCRLGNRASE